METLLEGKGKQATICYPGANGPDEQATDRPAVEHEHCECESLLGRWLHRQYAKRRRHQSLPRLSGGLALR